MKFFHTATALAAAMILPTLAQAQAQAQATGATGAAVQTGAGSQTGTGLAVGAKIYDPQGAEVGTVESVAGGNVIVNTGTNRATLAATAFGTGAKGPTLNTTRAQLDAMVADAAAKASTATKAALVPGAQVRGKSGAVVGTVKEVTGDQVVIERPQGPVSLTAQYFTTDANGLSLTMTAEELDAATKAATPTASTAPNAASQ